MDRARIGGWAAANWFLLCAPFLALAGLAFSRSVAWPQDGGVAEAVLLFDACVSLPLLYALCYRGRLNGWRLALRMLAVACLGIWLVAWLVPPASQTLLPHFGWARIVGLGVLVLVELRLVIAALRMVFGGNASAEEVAASTGAPPFIARLMVLEARFWKAVGRLLRR